MKHDQMATPPVKPRHRFFRFSLRGLLVLILVVAIALAWAIRKAREQGNAVAALEKVGCQIEYDWIESEYRGRSLTMLERLRMLLGDDKPMSVTEVKAHMSKITDADLVHFEGLDHLQTLWLDGMPITDAGLAHLRNWAAPLVRSRPNERDRRRIGSLTRVDSTFPFGTLGHKGYRRRAGAFLRMH